MNIKTPQNTARNYSMDLLRILATFLVILIHVSTFFFSVTDVQTFDWKVYTIYDGISRSCVPLFVLISGAFWLSKDKDVFTFDFFKKYVLILLLIYIFWSFFYALVDPVNLQFGFTTLYFKNVVTTFIYSRYHLWFLPMIIGLYLLLPIIQLVINNATKKHIQYFLGLFLVLTIARQTLLDLLSFTRYEDLLNTILNKISFGFLGQYLGYFILGYYLYKYEITKKYRKSIYLLGVLSVILSIFISIQTSIIHLFDYFHITILLESMALFIFFKYSTALHSLGQRHKKIISVISSSTLGIYVLHDYIMNILSEIFNLNARTFNPILSIPIVSLIIFFLSFIIIGGIKKIPVLKKLV